MRELSMRDIETVSGAVGPVGAAIGAASAAATYIGYASGSGEGSVAGLIGSTVTGALVGFATGPAGVTAMQTGAWAILSTQVGFYGGMAGGLAERAMDATGTDYNDPAGTGYN